MTVFVFKIVRNVPGFFRGQVQHVRSGETRTFTSMRQAAEWVQRMSAADSGPPPIPKTAWPGGKPGNGASRRSGLRPRGR